MILRQWRLVLANNQINIEAGQVIRNIHILLLLLFFKNFSLGRFKLGWLGLNASKTL